MRKWFLKNGFIIVLISIIAAIFSCLKELVFAGLFGISNIADAYTVAMAIPEVLFAAVWNALNTILIPMYQDKLQNNGKEDAHRFISNFLGVIVIMTTIFVCFNEAIANTWIYLFAPGFDKLTHNIAVSISRCIFPILIFESIERICIGVLQTHKKFIFAKIITITRNILIIIFLISFTSEFGIYAAIAGLLIGVVMEALFAYFGSRKVEDIRFGVDFKDKSLHEAAKLAVPVMVGAGVSEINVLIDKVVASYFETGSLIALTYASRMEGMITTILLINIVSLSFPFVSEYVARNEIYKLKIIFENTLKILLIISVPMVVGGVVLGKDIISIVFLRGAFDYQAVLLVAPLFSVYLTSSLFNTIRTMSVNVFASYGETKHIMYNTIFAVAINSIFNIIFSMIFGIIGLAIASLISAIFSSLGLLLLINKNKFKIDFLEIDILVLKVLLSSMIMGIVIQTIKLLFERFIDNYVLINHLIEVIVIIFVGGVVYFLTMKVLRVKELNKFVFK